jgi:5-methylcytosine-specific restriction endonuclease McrA
MMMIFEDKQECEECGFSGVFITEEYGNQIIKFCPECYKITESLQCKHEKSTLIKYEVNGKYRVQNMCNSCYSLHGNLVKQADIDISTIKLIDKQKYDKYQNDLFEKGFNRRKKLSQDHEEWRKTAWLREHNNYLKSFAWKEKRDEVLRRDNYTCMSCLKARATQVHHLTYKHWRNEPLFELISVCDECHEKITRMDNQKILA